MRPFSITGVPNSSFLTWFAQGLQDIFSARGYTFSKESGEDTAVVFNVIDADRPRPIRRKAQATFVVSIVERQYDGLDDHVHVLKSAYPYLIRSLSNHLIYISHAEEETKIYCITPEQGCYQVTYRAGEDQEDLFNRIYERLEPLASSQLVIDNQFLTDLPQDLWDGDEYTERLSRSGKKLDEMNLLPAPFPLEEYVTQRDMRHIKKLYGIGGLSYGNLSSRKDEETFWMSASGVNKADMKVVGQDMLLIKGYDAEMNRMQISVPPEVDAKRASVDAIEHWMIYTEHPDIGAIVHVHAWMDGIEATEINYPCGTLQLAESVAELIRKSDEPSQAVIGLKNHGLTITGTDLDDIFERIEGRIIPQVPMS